MIRCDYCEKKAVSAIVLFDTKTKVEITENLCGGHEQLYDKVAPLQKINIGGKKYLFMRFIAPVKRPEMGFIK